MAHVDKTTLLGIDPTRSPDHDTGTMDDDRYETLTANTLPVRSTHLSDGPDTKHTGRPGTLTPPYNLPGTHQHTSLISLPPLPPSPGDTLTSHATELRQILEHHTAGKTQTATDRHREDVTGLESPTRHDSSEGPPSQTTSPTIPVPSDTPDPTNEANTSHSPRDNPISNPLPHIMCTGCKTLSAVHYNCDSCTQLFCVNCMTADWGQGEMRCHQCETDSNTKVPGGPNPPPPGVLATQSSTSQMSLSSDSSVSSGGSSYSQRSTKQTLRRRQIPAKLGTSAISTTTTKSGNSTAATSTTTPITPAPNQRPTRRSMQPPIDTMLRPRGGRTSKVLPPTRSRGTNNPKNNA